MRNELSLVNVMSGIREILIDEKYGFKINDLSHGMNHLEEVFLFAVEINVKEKLEIDLKEIMVVCFLHDLFTFKDRENHHYKGEEFIYWTRNKMIRKFSEEAKTRMGRAILEHRASDNLKFYSKLSELLYVADKGRMDLKENIVRSFWYTKTKDKNLNIEEISLNVRRHMVEKFGINGYCKYSKLQKKVIGNLEEYEKLHENVSMDYVREICLKENEKKIQF